MADEIAPFSRSLMDQRAVSRYSSGNNPYQTSPLYGQNSRESRPASPMPGLSPSGARPSNQLHGAAEIRPGKDPEGLLRVILMVIIGVLCLVVLFELGFQLFIAPQMRIQRISLDSDLELTRDAILGAAGISANELFYAIDPETVEARLRAVPAVLEAQVTMVFPDMLSIKLRSRQALVVSLMRQENGRQVPVLIDSMGMAFHVGLMPQNYDMPVLTGIEFRNFRSGLQLPRSVVPFLQDLQALRLQDPALYHAFSEFRLLPVGTGQVEILAYTIMSPVGVRINARLSQEAALYIVRTLDMIARTEGMARIQEIDFRTNNVVYKKGDN